MTKVVWNEHPAAHDYPAAASYLALLAEPALVTRVVSALQAAPVEHFKAKDILRSAKLPLLPTDDPRVALDLKCIKKGKALSPVLLVRGDLVRGEPSQVADGYHRVCASYHTNEDTDIPCRIAELSTGPSGPRSSSAPSVQPAVKPAVRTRQASSR